MSVVLLYHHHAYLAFRILELNQFAFHRYRVSEFVMSIMISLYDEYRCCGNWKPYRNEILDISYWDLKQAGLVGLAKTYQS